MSLENTHPQYDLFAPDWQQCRDTYRGSRYVKDRGAEYLPPLESHLLDGYPTANPGVAAYTAYIQRAVFYDFVKDATETLLGMMHAKDAVITLPPALEYLRNSATRAGEPLLGLLRRINEEQLVVGRAGIMLDLPAVQQSVPLPYLALYTTEAVRNWDDTPATDAAPQTLSLVILDESANIRQPDFRWQWEERYRVLQLDEAGVYTQALFHGTAFVPDMMQPPVVRGEAQAAIPFQFVNTKDTTSQPDVPPLLGLAELSLAIYRSEADYRQALHMQSQDTLVIIAGPSSEDVRTGAGAILHLKQGGDAKYIGVSSTGIPEQRAALEADRARAVGKTGSLMNSLTRSSESGEALQTRVSAETASLHSLAIAAAQALERLLRTAAVWVGANPDDVKVEPNLEFAPTPLEPQALMNLMTAKTLGAPISQKSIHAWIYNKGLTALDYDTELDEIEAEPPLGSGTGTEEDPPAEDPADDPAAVE